jgi:hypothetical protein
VDLRSCMSAVLLLISSFLLIMISLWRFMLQMVLLTAGL